MKQGFNPLPPAPGYGAPALSQAFINTNAQQKPIRPFFKVPSEGVYKMAEEVVFNPPKAQRKSFQPLAGTKISFVTSGDGKTDGKEKKVPQESFGIYFVINIAENTPLYYLKDARTAAAKEKIAPLSFREMPTCHAINRVTATASKFDLLVGFGSGDVLRYEPLTKAAAVQFNKDHCLATGKVTMVAWVPGTTNEFAVSFTSGVLLFMNSDCEDQPSSTPSSKEPTDSFCVVKQKNPKHNPVSKWNISSKAINGFAFSPSGKYIAVASQDGYLRVFDCEEETMQVAFRSYYGGFTCVAWSPDGKYLVTGGEDDLVCVWSLLERCLLARGQGHRSWVTEVRFDPWGCCVGPNNSTYRIASVGEDTRLLLWDFERETLRRPRNMSLSFSSHRIGGPDFKMNLSQVQSQVLAQTQQTQTNSNNTDLYKAPIIESRGRNEVSHIHPLVEHRTHHEPVSDVYFLEHFLVTCSWGKVKFWARPTESPADTPSPLPVTSTTLPTTSSIPTSTASADNSTTSITPTSATSNFVTSSAIPSTTPSPPQ